MVEHAMGQHAGLHRENNRQLLSRRNLGMAICRAQGLLGHPLRQMAYRVS